MSNPLTPAVGALSNTGAGASSTQTQAATALLPQQTLNQDDFLKLLIAQMSAQDPMNPVKDTDFVSQMAQFSSLEQAKTMQKDLAGLQNSQTTLQAYGLLGRNVQVQVASGQTVTGVVSAIGFQAGTPSITINGQSYDLSQVLSVSLASPNPSI